jgi:hypothetical protein
MPEQCHRDANLRGQIRNSVHSGESEPEVRLRIVAAAIGSGSTSRVLPGKAERLFDQARYSSACLLQNAQLVLGGEPPPLRLYSDLWVYFGEGLFPSGRDG